MKIPKECKSCSKYWTRGIKDGGHNMWCCKYGKPAPKAFGECKLKNGYEPKGLK